jgi:hypothetical protein
MSIIVFDFDDTLFTTTYFKSGTIQPTIIPDFSELDNSIVHLVNTALKYGKVYIISNANKEWIQLCSALLPKFKQLNIPVFSSIEEGYDMKYDIPLWKVKMFEEKLSPLLQEGKQLISFGDTPFDRAAALHMKNLFPKIIVKNVMFKCLPDLKTLLFQQKVLADSFEGIISHDTHLDLQFIIS